MEHRLLAVSRMRAIAGLAWIGLYLLIVLVPVFLMLVPPVPSGRAFLLELAVALGFVGLTQIAVQFILIARFRRLTAPYGIDIILRYHRQIALVALAAILLHPLIIVADNPARLRLLNPAGGTLASKFGLVSLAALITTVVISTFRERLRLRYERWRGAHIALGVTAIVFAQAHVSLAGLYTNTWWKQTVWIATAAVMVGLVIVLRLIRPALQRNYRWRVTSVRPELGDTHSLELEAVEHEGIRFGPGQFAWIKLASSPYTLEEHPFSFTSSAERGDRVEFGIKALGDFTSRIAEVRPGTRAWLDGPHGAFNLDRYEAAAYVFLAGGAGIAPFMSMLRTMADRGDRRPVTLIYADKEWETVAYRDEIAGLEGSLGLETIYVLENPPANWDGERGLVTTELLDRRLPSDALPRFYLVCGPPPMMELVQAALHDKGVSQEWIQLERFALV